MERELQDRIAIVTGAAQGIGEAIAGTLSREGAIVIVADMNEEKAMTAAEKIGPKCDGAYVDISDIASMDALVDLVISRFGRIDVLVNNAGVSQQVDFLAIDPATFDRVVDINLRGMVFLTQKVMKHMIDKRYGRIVNIASLAGERGGKFAGIHYSASKAGVIAATKCMAMRGGEYGITANAIAPGLIKTPMGDGLAFNTDEIPMKRLGTAEEVAEAAAFLASDRARYITGSTVDVNGGILMR